MPVRLLRDWTDSDRVQSLTWEAEVMFTRLIMRADDFGCYHADPRMLSANLFPLRPEVTTADIERWLAELARGEVGSGVEPLVRLYRDGKKMLLQIHRFDQRLRRKRRIFSAPPWETDGWDQSNQQLNSDLDGHRARAAHAACPPEVEVEVEVEVETPPVAPQGGVAGNDQASADRGPAPRIAQPVKPRTRGTSARADSGASAPRPKPDDQRVIDAYCEGFRAVHDGRKPAVTGRCRKEIRGMLAEGLDVEDVIAAIPAYLAIEHGWVAENGWPLHAFPREWNRLATARSAGTAVAVRSALPDRARLSRSGQVAVNALERTFARIDAEAAELKGGKP